MKPDGLTPEELQQVLARAIAFDEMKRARYSEAEVRYTASQVGVSNDALDAALQSIDRPSLKDSAPVPTLLQLMRVPAASGFVAGLSISALYAIAIDIFNMNGVMSVPNWAMNCLMMVSGALTALSATDGNVRRYFARNLGLWFGFGMGVFTVYRIVIINLFKPGHLFVGVVLSHVLAVPILALTLSCIVGGVMLTRGGATSSNNDSDNMAGGIAGKVSRVWRSVKAVLNTRISFMKNVYSRPLKTSASAASGT